MGKSVHIKLLVGIVLAVVVVTYRWWAPQIGVPTQLPNGEVLRLWFEGFGIWGPAVVVGTMMLAILVSPIPSAPIALAAGAIYGHLWGTLYVVIGSEAGALAAFSIAQFFGYEAIHKRFGDQLGRHLTGSQNFLTGVVFASRLLPFISFDIVSYAAGLTPLKFWRFAVATLAGILPASFLLAHFGSELIADESDQVLLAVFVLGSLATIPIVLKLLTNARKN